MFCLEGEGKGCFVWRVRVKGVGGGRSRVFYFWFSNILWN